MSNQLPIYQVDAFTDTLFRGNPAAVVPLDKWLPDDLMQNIAIENNLSETAFFVGGDAPDVYHLRWFTPGGEVRLCGHATLATAFVIDQILGRKLPVKFETLSGTLTVALTLDLKYHMELPADHGELIEMDFSDFDPPFDTKIVDILRGKDDLLLLLENEQMIRDFKPDDAVIKKLPTRGLIISAQGKDYDFVSRCFYPKYKISEDPVTGSAHTLLTPYWSSKLRKNNLSAYQASDRGGQLTCIYKGNQVGLVGEARLYLQGTIYYPRFIIQNS